LAHRSAKLPRGSPTSPAVNIGSNGTTAVVQKEPPTQNFIYLIVDKGIKSNQ
jgi:hypothetical protein